MLSKAIVENVIAAALSTGGDFAEVFVEEKRNTVIAMVGGQVEESVAGRDFGVGIRIFHGLNSVYAYTNAFEGEKLAALARQAAHAIPGSRKQDLVLNLLQSPGANIHPVRVVPSDVPLMRRVAVMREANDAARGYRPEISQVTVRYLDEDQNVLIANSEGTFAEDRRIRTRLMIEAVAAGDAEMQTGFCGPGAHRGFEFFDTLDVKGCARDAARTAVTMLHAEPCPSGKFPVIIDNEFGGVIFHEACGHGLEATAVAKKASVFAGHLGEQIAPEIVTAIDDGTLPNLWGSQNLDDEGEPTRRNVLIENGVLKGYLIDRLNARRMGMAHTGSSRRQSYKFAPTSRMTNTYIAAGKWSPAEIIESTEFAIYAKQMAGGSVHPATGDYNFAVREGYIVRKGKVCEPVRGATLIGNGLETLKKIDRVGNNLEHGQGMCGSVSGSIPVNVGQPTIRVSELTVGGRKGR